MQAWFDHLIWVNIFGSIYFVNHSRCFWSFALENIVVHELSWSICLFFIWNDYGMPDWLLFLAPALWVAVFPVMTGWVLLPSPFLLTSCRRWAEGQHCDVNSPTSAGSNPNTTFGASFVQVLSARPIFLWNFHVLRLGSCLQLWSGYPFFPFYSSTPIHFVLALAWDGSCKLFLLDINIHIF